MQISEIFNVYIDTYNYYLLCYAHQVPTSQIELHMSRIALSPPSSLITGAKIPIFPSNVLRASSDIIERISPQNDAFTGFGSSII